jgi:hypothetical protein
MYLTHALGLGAGIVLGGATVAGLAAAHHDPPSPGVLTGREVLAGSTIPIGLAAGIGFVRSLNGTFAAAGPEMPNGQFAGGVALGVLGASLVLGSAWGIGQLRDH